ncbi:hypothetical protein [Paenibacillus sp. UNC499MF]|uniref:hypothetical protein n=1 Tax=Paenibacillus sp. UNC499MF TaxID=1502751 RepID=UPI0008A01BB3|nr:hypothetical protein [Paenibacillus sp. UNC499MF]SEG47141.1 hypothetical protein SAMN02799616_03145 [Paenibacillus sp. UNC499MF]
MKKKSALPLMLHPLLTSLILSLLTAAISFGLDGFEPTVEPGGSSATIFTATVLFVTLLFLFPLFLAVFGLPSVLFHLFSVRLPIRLLLYLVIGGLCMSMVPYSARYNSLFLAVGFLYAVLDAAFFFLQKKQHRN